MEIWNIYLVLSQGSKGGICESYLSPVGEKVPCSKSALEHKGPGLSQASLFSGTQGTHKGNIASVKRGAFSGAFQSLVFIS